MTSEFKRKADAVKTRAFYDPDIEEETEELIAKQVSKNAVEIILFPGWGSSRELPLPVIIYIFTLAKLPVGHVYELYGDKYYSCRRIITKMMNLYPPPESPVSYPSSPAYSPTPP